MSDTKKMLRAVINGQSAMKSELLGEIGKVRLDVEKVDKKIDRVEKNLERKIMVNTKRLDVIGKQVAYLEDDAPTREEHDELVGRVGKVEHAIASV